MSDTEDPGMIGQVCSDVYSLGCNLITVHTHPNVFNLRHGLLLSLLPRHFGLE